MILDKYACGTRVTFAICSFVRGAGAWSAMPLGMLIGGVLTEQLGVRPMLLGLGFIYLITTLSMAFIPAMKEMNRKAPVME